MHRVLHLNRLNEVPARMRKRASKKPINYRLRTVREIGTWASAAAGERARPAETREVIKRVEPIVLLRQRQERVRRDCWLVRDLADHLQLHEDVHEPPAVIVIAIIHLQPGLVAVSLFLFASNLVSRRWFEPSPRAFPRPIGRRVLPQLPVREDYLSFVVRTSNSPCLARSNSSRSRSRTSPMVSYPI